jgi:hypothetical protein
MEVANTLVYYDREQLLPNKFYNTGPSATLIKPFLFADTAVQNKLVCFSLAS